jgi:hypothetical protein
VFMERLIEVELIPVKGKFDLDVRVGEAFIQ